MWAVRACGARERVRERGGRAAHRAEHGGAEGERRQSRPHTASPMGLRNIVGEEVAATFESFKH